MKQLIENNLTLTFALFCVLGLFIPDLEYIPNSFLIVSLAIVIFLACFRIEFSNFKTIAWQRVILFYTVRFILLPICIYYLISQISPTFAIALFLLTLLPAATSSPAMTSIFKGNVSLSFVLLILSSLLAPFVISLLVHFIIGKSIEIRTMNLFITLVLSILVPIICFGIIRLHQSTHHWLKENGPFYAVILIGITFSIATAKRKDIILTSPHSIILPFIISTAGFAFFYIIGWILGKYTTIKNQITYALSSGANNISIGVSIAILYFPPETSLFLIISIFPWLLALTPFKKWLRPSP